MPLDIQISITNWPVMLIFEESIWPFSSPLSAKITNIERDKFKRYTERKDFFVDDVLAKEMNHIMKMRKRKANKKENRE